MKGNERREAPRGARVLAETGIAATIRDANNVHTLGVQVEAVARAQFEVEVGTDRPKRQRGGAGRVAKVLALRPVLILKRAVAEATPKADNLE